MTTDRERFDELDIRRPVRLVDREGVPEQAHLFDQDSVLAVRAALAAKRPLLVRGEPGVGKTQLAAAVAVVLQRPLVPFVVDARTESTDLLWHFDSVRRLAEAQLCGALELADVKVEQRLEIRRYVTPGPLWWGFDWYGADRHAEGHGLPRRQVIAGADPNNGCVVLIDEIDKADSDVPNGLLEAMGAGEFTPEGCDRVQVVRRTPLVVVTTNEERALPDAFVRRCLVLRLEVPAGESLKRYLIDRGRAHFRRIDERDDAFVGREIDESLLAEAAQMLVTDRNAGITPLPGLAEYLDLLRAVRELADEGVGTASELLQSVRRFTLRKHLETSL